MATPTISLVNPELCTSSLGKRKNVSNFFDNLKDELSSVNQKKCVSGSSSPHPLPFKSAQEEKATQVEVVTFQGRHKKKAKLEIPGSDDSKVRHSYLIPSCLEAEHSIYKRDFLKIIANHYWSACLHYHHMIKDKERTFHFVNLLWSFRNNLVG